MGKYATQDLNIKPEKLIGKRIGKFEVKAILGRGGMGIVYKVWDTLEEEYKAIKVVPDELSRDRLSIESLKNEVKAASRISHPNVIRVLGLEEKDGLFFIVMEYIQGESLTDKLANSKTKKLSENEVVKIMKDLALGLQEAHKKNVIHRDIKF